MKLGMVVPNQYPNDTRVERGNCLLQERGHEVHVLCVRQEGQSYEEMVEGVWVYRLDMPCGFGSRLNAIFYKLVLMDCFWAWHIHRFIQATNVQVVHVHHVLSIVPATILAGRWHSCPVVYDVHDSYPEALKAWKRKKSLNERILLGIPRMRWLEKTCARLVDYVVLANKGDYPMFSTTYGLAPNKMALFENVVNYDWMMRQTIDERVITQFRDIYTIFYVGSFGAMRGLDTMVRSMPAIIENIPAARLVLAGPNFDSEPERDQMIAVKRLASELHVLDKVLFVGQISSKELPTYLTMSDVCLFTLKRCDHYEKNLGNKLFEYMAFGKPVVVTDVRAQKDVVDEVECGLVIQPGDYQGLARAIIWLHDNPTLAVQMGARGKIAVKKKYNIRAMSDEFLRLYTQIEKRVSQPKEREA